MPKYQTLMPIKTKGSGLPLFCVHGQPLKVAQRMQADRPVYGLSHVYHTDFLAEQPECIEDLAAEYLAEVRLVQPHGPYHFCGFSAGGMIAFEMVRQLLEQGEKIETLVLAEPTFPPRDNLRTRMKHTISSSPSKMKLLFALIKRAPKSIRARIRFRALRLAAWTLLTLRQPLPEALRWLGYLRLLGPAMKRYTYNPIDCHATLLYQNMDEESYQNTASFWGWIFKQGAEVIVFPDVTHHNHFMLEPALTEVVALAESRQS